MTMEAKTAAFWVERFAYFIMLCNLAMRENPTPWPAEVYFLIISNLMYLACFLEYVIIEEGQSIAEKEKNKNATCKSNQEELVKANMEDKEKVVLKQEKATCDEEIVKSKAKGECDEEEESMKRAREILEKEYQEKLKKMEDECEEKLKKEKEKYQKDREKLEEEKSLLIRKCEQLRWT
ncbi:hypothetical protein L1049_015472 [Liquidambar formosana]|uniref:Uncharacterized protein n=1 Tax=Liquidambar formosana TaxID=63359 RepID=A0AAP0X658_LIQFO